MDESSKALCPELAAGNLNSESSCPALRGMVTAGTLSKVERGDAWTIEYWETRLCVECGEDEMLWLLFSGSASRSMVRVFG
jgi:hypothetical protein